ncbi:MAG TPA: acyltransferase, partial [Micromonosporaceae bacterium]|nr:acyltransferase [Micromonosporaceae bacterium]
MAAGRLGVPAAGAPPPAAGRVAPGGRVAPSGHLAQVDALRVITCFSVLTVHVLGVTEVGESIPSNLVQIALHYSRYVFFVVSALVLVHSYAPKADPAGRLPGAQRFRRHRLLVIGVPYAVWTAAYLIHAQWPHESAVPLAYARSLWVGDGKYHLYFLVVSLQFGLLFPWCLRLVAATRGRHIWLLAIGAAAQIATYAIYYYVGLPGGWLSPVAGEASLVAYQFWLLLGAVIAVNLDVVHAWLVEHVMLVIIAVAVSLVAAEAVFLVDSEGGTEPNAASTSLQPVTVAYAVPAFGLLYLLACRLAAVRSTAVRSAIRSLARLSFGIYLVHPAAADFVDAHYHLLARHLPQVELTVLVVVATAVLTVPMVALMG